MKNLLREPLLHFLLIGAVLFLIDVPAGRTDASGARINVSAGRIEQLAAVFVKTWQRPPTGQELQGLIDDFVLEEVYYRQAVAMGLDRDDTIIRRRLRQKLEFLTDDMAALVDPSEQDLAAYLAANEANFREEPLYTFRQVYFNPEKLDGDAESRLARQLDSLNAGGTPAGDSGLLPESFDQAPRRQVDATFGTGFSRQLDELGVGAWQGPLRSGLGFHLVRLEERTPGRLLGLAEIRPVVEREWANEKRGKLRRETNERLLADYDVVVEWPEGAGPEGS